MKRIDQRQCSLLATFQTKVKRNTLEFCPYCAILLSTGLHFRTALGKISSSIVLLIVFRLANANYTASSVICFNTVPKSNLLSVGTAQTKVLFFFIVLYANNLQTDTASHCQYFSPDNVLRC